MHISALNPKKNMYSRIFVILFLSMMVIFLPIIIFNKGYFIYYGDFNSQQLMFYNHCNEAIKNGTMWDWYTDLGSDFIGAYSFYTLGSPFFWLTVLFPPKIAPMLLPWLLAIKTGIAGVTSYGFIKRFVKTENAAAIGAMLYAMSGFQTYNIFFNHFHDVTALFPLLLIALEERIQNDRRGVFALAVAMMASINYFFFTGQVVFLIIYFTVRLCTKSYKLSLSKFFGLAIESVLGVALAAVILLPSVLLVLTNSRVDGRIYGLSAVVYPDKTRLHRIIQSIFMLPDPPARSNLFDQNTAKWSSMAAYLPLFSTIGVISFMKKKNTHWATRIIYICLFMACVPILNSAFYMFNSSYYARWYYMPILLMAFMTAYAIDNEDVGLKRGYLISFLVPVFFGLITFIPKEDKGQKVWFDMAQHSDLWIIQLLVTFGCLMFALYLILEYQRTKAFLKTAFISTIAGCFICTAAVVYYGVAQGPLPHEYTDFALTGDENIKIEDDSFYRIDVSESKDNWPMLWGDYANIRAFQSVVNGSVMDFYRFIGVERSVATRPETSIYALRGFTSTKYYFDFVGNTKKDVDLILLGFSYYDTQNGFDIYQNDYHVPMGFAYDMYFDTEKYEEYSAQTKQNLLMAACYLTDEQIEKYSDIMTCFEDTVEKTTDHLRFAGYVEDCKKAQAQACYEFEENPHGFEARIKLDKESLVFFSVPYSEGFTAYVNGNKTEIDKVYDGLCAVRVPQGDNEIVFEYETPGLKVGFVITMVSAMLLSGYILLYRRFVKKVVYKAEFDYSPVWADEPDDDEDDEDNDEN